jgi:hypothetical protein
MRSRGTTRIADASIFHGCGAVGQDRIETLRWLDCVVGISTGFSMNGNY